MGLGFKARAVAGPVVEDLEAVRGLDLPQLHLDAVVGITVSGEDAQAPPRAGCGQLLGDDPDFAKTQPGWGSASQFRSRISS
jgi:hypothetical protein